MADSPEIEHIVLYSLRDHETSQTVVKFIKDLVNTAKKDGKPYIRSIKVGTTRPYGKIRSLGFNIASVVTFANDEDRVYFVKEDPAHQELIKLVGTKLTKEVLSLDFVDGLADNTIRVEDC